MKRAFDHILIIMLENQYRGYVMENEYMRNLAAQGIELCNSFGVMHPSQTNYIASISGELCNVSDDDQPPVLPQKTIVDLIEASPQNLSWKAYMDSYIADDTPWKAENFTPKDNYPYVIKHNPFSSYANILSNEERWKKIDNEAGFYRDLLNGDFPEYAWFTPNMWNDGHYVAGTTNDSLDGERAPGLVDQQARWLESFFQGLNFPGPNSKLPKNTLVVVTYDEADFEAFFEKGKKYYYDGPNQIYTVLLGDGISPGKQYEGYNHYSLLKTVEKNFNLGSLEKNDRDCNWFQFLWGREFKWQEPQATKLESIAAAESFEGQLYLYSEDNGKLLFQTFDGQYYSDAMEIAADCKGSLAVSANKEQMLLAYKNDKDKLSLLKYTMQKGWQECVSPISDDIDEVAITAIPNLGSFLMVCRDSSGEMYSISQKDGQWQQKSAALCAESEGSFELAALGATLLLIYRIKGSTKMACLTYNSADFNVMTIPEGQYSGPYDDATIDCWSPNAFLLNHFSQGQNALTPGEPEPVSESYRSEGVFAVAEMDGVIYLVHNNPGNFQLLSESFSISGLLTPKLPVSYDAAKATVTSNGYGTMAEAGWTEQKAVNGVFRKASADLVMSSFKNKIYLFFKPENGSGVHVVEGFATGKSFD